MFDNDVQVRDGHCNVREFNGASLTALLEKMAEFVKELEVQLKDTPLYATIHVETSQSFTVGGDRIYWFAGSVFYHYMLDGWAEDENGATAKQLISQVVPV